MANNYHEVRQYDFSIYIIIWEKSAGITKKYLLVNTLSNYFRTVSDRKKFFLCLWWIPFYSPPPPPLSFRRNILFQNLISFTSMWSRWPTPLLLVPQIKWDRSSSNRTSPAYQRTSTTASSFKSSLRDYFTLRIGFQTPNSEAQWKRKAWCVKATMLYGCTARADLTPFHEEIEE